jgi:hypothetical protein
VAVKIKVARDEYWPFPIIGVGYGTELTVPAATRDRWNKAIADFEAVAGEIGDEMEKQTGSRL